MTSKLSFVRTDAAVTASKVPSTRRHNYTDPSFSTVLTCVQSLRG